MTAIPTQWLEATAAVRQRTALTPEVGLVLGSGLSGLADEVSAAAVIPYAEIPHWPTSTVPGHSDQLIVGTLEGKRVLVQQGRVHLYEGYAPKELTLPVRVMQLLGVKTLIVTNAAGGLNRSFSPGDLMLIRDHINMPGLAGNNPLRGPNYDELGPRFPDMISAYDSKLRQLARDVADRAGIGLREGVYAYVAGPSYETPAELRLLEVAGADAVGMSTVPSVIVARHGGMRVMGFSSITNMALPDPIPGTELSHAEVLEVGKVIVPRLMKILKGVLHHL